MDENIIIEQLEELLKSLGKVSGSLDIQFISTLNTLYWHYASCNRQLKKGDDIPKNESCDYLKKPAH